MTPRLFQFVFALIVTLLLACTNRSGHPIISSKKDTLPDSTKMAPVVDTPRSFVKNYGASASNRLFVFVGEKISVAPLPTKLGGMDNCFKAKYAILKTVYGHFSEDTIEFIVYDHYGKPAFSTFKNVLLYVSADSGTYYHQKYLYDDVYLTKDGRWAGPYAREDYEHPYNKHTKIKPVKIDFAQRVAFPIKTIDERGRHLTFSYPKPYFKTLGDSVIAVYGNFAADLFTLKKTGFLTARGMFKAKH